MESVCSTLQNILNRLEWPIGQIHSNISKFASFIWEIKWKLFSHIHIVWAKSLSSLSTVWQNFFQHSTSRQREYERGRERITYQSSFHRRAKTKRFQMCTSFMHGTKQIFNIYVHNELCMSVCLLLQQKLVSRQHGCLIDSLPKYHSLIDLDNYIGLIKCIQLNSTDMCNVHRHATAQ